MIGWFVHVLSIDGQAQFVPAVLRPRRWEAAAESKVVLDQRLTTQLSTGSVCDNKLALYAVWLIQISRRCEIQRPLAASTCCPSPPSPHLENMTGRGLV